MRELYKFIALFAIFQGCLADTLFDINRSPVRTFNHSDDGSIELIPSKNFPFFGTNVTRFYVGMNGIISINTPVSAYDTSGWPTNSYAVIGASAILPFWSDVNGYYSGSVKTREALPDEIITLKNQIFSNRPITALNVQSAILIEWADVSPCGCFFPRNTIQVALVSDGCTSYAILSYPIVRWGNSEGARVGTIIQSPTSHTELAASSSRTLQTLVNGKFVLYFGGENVCTGQTPGSIVRNPPNSQTFITCGQCSIAQNIVCEAGKFYDPACGKCVVNAAPNCDNPVNGGYTAWSNEGVCTTTCGNGLQRQVRSCTNPVPRFGGLDCTRLGPSVQNVACNLRECPVNGGYTAWSNQGVCSTTCGVGVQNQTRTCTNPVPQFGGASCIALGLGPSSQQVACNLRNCPINGGYSAWANQGVCSTTCGIGIQNQVRTCTNPAPQFGGINCDLLGPSTQQVACNLRNCPINGGYTAWSNQGVCSTTCGAGLQTQVRTCTNPVPQFGGADCTLLGPTTQQVACNLRNCPINGGYTAWANQGVCSTTCGVGVQNQVRTCTNPAPQFGGADCTALGPSTQQVACSLRNCPINGGYTAWNNQGVCSRTCGGGLQVQVRTCTNPAPQFGGANCTLLGPSTQQVQCNTAACSIHGGYSEWFNQGTCSLTCGGGLQLQIRTCTNPPPQFGGRNCSLLGPSSRQVACNTASCPINGGYTAWANQGVCSRTCGGGVQNQIRTCTNPTPQFGGRNCSLLGPSTQQVACNTASCPINGGYTAWANQGVCSTTCGVGVQNQTRTCTNPVPQFGGASCIALGLGPSSQQVVCNLRNCPINGGYTAWANQGVCSTTCGIGIQNQIRTCTNPTPQFGGADCTLLGPSTQQVSCNLRSCPINGGYTAWANDGSCSTTCGAGLQRQVRTCTNPVPQFGGSDCTSLGPSVQNVACNIRACPQDGGYTAWVNSGVCTVTCGGGLQRQTRSCTNPPPLNGGRNCTAQGLGPAEQFVSCGNDRCPDICTNNNALDNAFVYDVNNRTYFCECERTVDNTRSYVRQCYNCPAGTLYDPTVETCILRITFACTAHPSCVGKAAGDYSIWEGFANASCSHLYYTCDSFQQRTDKSCGVVSSGTYFNAISKTCVSGNPSPSCPNYLCVGRLNGNYERFDDLCRSYYQCVSFTSNVASCLPGSFYDNVQRRCVVSTEPPAGQNCLHPNCLGKADGVYVVDNRCEAYYRCVGQRQTEFVNCPADQYYDASQQLCSTTYPSGGVCQHRFCMQRNNVNADYSLTGTSCLNSYVRCSTVGLVPNVLTFAVCPTDTYFLVQDSNTFSGSCVSSPPASSCPNYQCIGRSNTYVTALAGFHDCRQYVSCNNQVVVLVQCPTGQYFNPTLGACSATLNEQFCQHPDCLVGGRQGGPGNYALVAGSQCSASYYTCDVNRIRTIQSCVISTSGQYFGLSGGVWQCLNGNAPSSCGANYVCIGKTASGSTFPFYDNPAEPYCTGYISCSINGVASLLTCPIANEQVQYLDAQTFRCSTVFPLNQNCRIDGGVSQWSQWAYVTGSTCSVTCGSNGVQLQQRTRLCNSPAPANGGTQCPGLDLLETRNGACLNVPPACGDSFCVGRAAGSYSKSWELTPPSSASCFKDYYICSGPPANTLTLGNCPSADYIFQEGNGCVRANRDASCGNLYCASRPDGLQPLSTSAHDCRQYVNCTNEFHVLLNCGLSSDGRPTYFNPTTSQCEVFPQPNCSPVIGFWSEWASDGLGCSVRASSLCQSREVRACNNPAPVSDASGCIGGTERFISCAAGQCGNTFCVNRATGNYSKTLALSPPVNFKCFKEFYYCQQPGNVLTEITCPLADYLFDPADSTCKRGTQDASCPNTYCGGRNDGLNPFSVTTVHDCRIYLNCLDEIATVLNCTNDPTTGKPRYYNNGVCSTVPPANGLCNPVFGFWSAWQTSGSCFTSGNQCVVRQVRTCSDPEPVPSNDPTTACAGGVTEQFLACDPTQCGNACSSNPCNSAGNTVCTNTPGVGLGYTCACATGFTYLSGNGTTLQCIDINECLVNNGGCGARSLCTNLVGTFTCQPEQCTLTPNPCQGSNTLCTSTNVSPGYSCSCIAGNWQTTGIGSSLSCIDINECVIGTSNCGSNRVCVNTNGGFVCNPAVCENSATRVCADSNAVCRSTNISPGFVCECPSGFTASGSGANVVCTAIVSTETCVGKANGFRIAVPTNSRQYQECQNGVASTVVDCPNRDMSIGLSQTFDEIFVPNGIWYSPVFRTCVNTTSNTQPPAAVPTNSDGSLNLLRACDDIANTPTANGGIVATKLPYPSDTQCKQWITCFNQQLENASQNPPEAGRCTTNLYDRDIRTCTFTLPQGSCPFN